jgi:hypothetical protein
MQARNGWKLASFKAHSLARHLPASLLPRRSSSLPILQQSHPSPTHSSLSIHQLHLNLYQLTQHRLLLNSKQLQPLQIKTNRTTIPNHTNQHHHNNEAPTPHSHHPPRPLHRRKLPRRTRLRHRLPRQCHLQSWLRSNRRRLPMRTHAECHRRHRRVLPHSILPRELARRRRDCRSRSVLEIQRCAVVGHCDEDGAPDNRDDRDGHADCYEQLVLQQDVEQYGSDYYDCFVVGVVDDQCAFSF